MGATGKATGLQIAFLIFALSIVCIPLSRVVIQHLGPGWEERQIFRLVVFVIGSLLIVSFPGVRAASAALLGRTIPQHYRLEVALVSTANVLMPFAFAGLFAIWTIVVDGPGGPDALLARQKPAQAQLEWSFSRSGVFVLFAAVFAAPILEELVFRGFLFRAWERRWGWRWAAMLTSATFAIYHLNFFSAFVESIVFICVMRRTGTLAAPIIVHATHNLALTYPVLGQFMFPVARAGLLETWALQFAFAAAAAIALPTYVWLAHRKPAPEYKIPA